MLDIILALGVASAVVLTLTALLAVPTLIVLLALQFKILLKKKER